MTPWQDWPIENVTVPPTSPAGIRPAATAFVPDEQTLTTIEAIADRLDAATEARKNLEEEEKFLRQRLAILCPIGTTQAGDRRVSVRVNKRFDHDTAMTVLTPMEVELCTVATISAAKAREVLAPERYAACQSEAGDPVVRVS